MKFKSALLTQASGSVGGMTASHNAGGMYLRARAIPTDPSTAQQQVVRNAVAALSTRWVETLTDAQRSAWAVYAANVPLVDSLGDPRPVSALSQYVRSNVPRVQVGYPIVDDGPTVFDLATFTPATIAIDTANDEVDVTFTNTDGWANEDDGGLFVYASAPKNSTINFFKGPYRLSGTIDGDGVTPPTSPAAITLPFAVVAGQRIFVQIRASRADGRLSAPFRLSSDAA